MKIKNVINGLMNKYSLDEITVMSDEEVIYSGSVEGWSGTSVDMILYKREIENADCKKRMIFNNKKAFLFI